MAKYVVLELTAGEAEHVDGLCTSCWLPALWKVGLYTLSEAGVRLAAIWSGCVECSAAGEVEFS